ncbi:MAG: pyridoxal phosphate-dependent aminotransferase [Halobacteria archaeon]|nr:pyridoxal phosphate-dependent aminotransferase [Halobacteria archaeon]
MDYQTPLFFHVMQYAAKADKDVIDMVSGNPDWGAPESIRKGLREYASLDSTEFQYPPSEGLLELRQEIADLRNVDESQVIVTIGGGEANYLAMARAIERESGSEFILTDPVYPYYPGKTKMLGGTATYVPTERDGSLDPSKVREKASDETALIMVNTPNNPTGAVYEEDVMRRLVEIAEENDALLVSDEVYDHFDFSGKFTSALDFESNHRVVTNSFSKTFGITGFRVGYAIFPNDLVDVAKTRHMLTNVAGNRPGQYAVLKALRETKNDYHERNLHLLEERVETFTQTLEKAGAEYMEPDGAFYVMARFPGLSGTLENVKKLIDEAGVAGMPGEAFGEARNEWVRFALVTPRAEEAAVRLGDYFGGK